MSQIAPKSPNRWMLAARPKTLPAGAGPVFLGGILAAAVGEFSVLPFLACLFGALLIQIGTNFANDYSDGLKGTDTERLGPPRAVASGLIHPQVMKGAVILTFLAVWIPGLYIVWRGGVPYLVIGVAAILSGLAYTGGPYPLGYNGLGDLFVFVFFGPVATGGTYYLLAENLPPEVLVASVAPGLFSVAILTVNNLRDIDGDQKAGKRTLPVRFGKGFARAEYVLCLIGATLAVPAIATVFTYDDPRKLNDVLAGTGQRLVMWTFLFGLAVLL